MQTLSCKTNDLFFPPHATGLLTMSAEDNKTIDELPYLTPEEKIERKAQWFKINNPKIEILFLDTKGGETAGNAAMTGLNSEVDIFIGPLFTDAVTQARAVTDQLRNDRSRPPMLLLSNNVDVASADRWLMGYIPEQELDGLLDYAVGMGKRRFALIAQDSLFSLSRVRAWRLSFLQRRAILRRRAHSQKPGFAVTLLYSMEGLFL